MPTKKKILVVDDEEDVQKAVSRLLAKMGYDVSSAGSVAEVQKILDQKKFDLIVLDLFLRGESSIDFLKDLRIERDINIPVVIITAYPSHDTVKQAKEYGVRHYLLKPLDVDRFQATVKSLLDDDKTDTEISVEKFPGLKSLIVSNDNKERLLLSGPLHTLDVKVLEADDGLDGMKIMKKEKPHVVFVSSMLPDVDGATMINRLEKSGVSEEKTFVLIKSEKPARGRSTKTTRFIKINEVTTAVMAEILQKVSPTGNK
jgi:DNA-binding response OmpR family regulator